MPKNNHMHMAGGGSPDVPVATDVPFGPLGFALVLGLALLVRGSLCALLAIVRSPYSAIIRQQDGLAMVVVAADARAAHALHTNEREIVGVLERISQRPARLHVAHPTKVPEGLAGPIVLALATCRDLGFVPSEWVGASPIWHGGAHDVAVLTDPSRDTLTGFESTKVVDTEVLPALNAGILDGVCQCRACGCDGRVVVVTGRTEHRDGSPTPMGADLAAVLDRGDSKHEPVHMTDLAGAAHGVRRVLKRLLQRGDAGTLVIARGGALDADELATFADVIRPHVDRLLVRGWQVHVAMGHADVAVRLPGVVEHPVPWAAAQAVVRRLEGESRPNPLAPWRTGRAAGPIVLPTVEVDRPGPLDAGEQDDDPQDGGDGRSA